ncbi:MAG: glycine cleavage system aminomethyltransferase GcvT [Candidatus Rokubacteria bacterium]|nr:glycine cleavage system aminomethyltransferase GcvT [Candidatus Rokubacteria bacterium]
MSGEGRSCTPVSLSRSASRPCPWRTALAEALKRTPLYGVHVRAGARMVPFGGWEMPVQYAGIVEEHRTVRSAVGLFDVSHMGEFEIAGPGAPAVLQRLTTNDASALAVGQVQYSLLCDPDGGIVDDLTIYRLDADRFMLTVNAANIEKDWAWVTAEGRGDARWKNISAETALLAVQGPRAEALAGRLADVDVTAIGYYRFARGKVAGVSAIISRTGYTGEDGFELYVSAGQAVDLWDALMDAGKADGIVPVGLGARDTLRLEMKYALYGNDIDQTTNPIEAGLGWVVKIGKGEFIGRPAVERVKAEGPRRKLVGFEMVDRAVARHGYRILKGGAEIGVVTSGSYGPQVDRYIGMGYVPTECSKVGDEFEVEVRGKGQRAKVVQTPFYPSKVKKS